MARKKKVELENIELKPQVIGYTYQKKTNIGRVIFIFIAFILVVYYINDISVFLNNLIGKETAETINKGTEAGKNDKDKVNNNSQNLEFYEFVKDLSISKYNLEINNFEDSDNILSFDINNNTSSNINLENRKLYIETYTESKNLIVRRKLNIKTINANSKMTFNMDILYPFNYIVINEMSVDDYPDVTLQENENEESSIKCVSAKEEITYNFKNKELVSISHIVNDNDKEDSNFEDNYASYKNKVAAYNALEGINATFEESDSGYKAIFNINLEKVNLQNLDEIYYYAYKEKPKVIKFEMQTYDFDCS